MGSAEHNPAVIENFLKFRGGFGSLVCGQISLAAHVGGIEGSRRRPKKPMRSLGQFIGNGDLQQFDGLCRLAMVQREKCAKRWQVTELDGRILREPPFRDRSRVLGGRAESPARASAKAAPYSTSRPWESSSAAIALCLAAGAFPNEGFPTRLLRFHRWPLFPAGLLAEPNPQRGVTSFWPVVTGRNVPEPEPLSRSIQSSAPGSLLARAASRSIPALSPFKNAM